MNRQSYHFDCQYRRFCFQITHFIIFSIILLGYVSYGVNERLGSGSCSANLTVKPMRCGHYPNSCIESEFVCDKIIDCSDGSDESNATCNKGLVCDDQPKPVCLHGGTCRSVRKSATRCAYHECDCVAPFTGANCSETSTTSSSPTTDSARTPSTSTAVGGGTPTSVTSKLGSTTQGIISQTSKIPQTESTLSQKESTTTLSNTNSSPVTNSQTLPHTEQQTDESMSKITSQSAVTTTNSSPTTASTEVSYKSEGKTTLPVPPPPKQTRPVKNIHTTTTTKTSKPNPSNPPSDFRTTVVLIVVFVLMFLIPVAIFIHCRMKRKHSHANFSQKPKKDDKEMLTPNDKTDFNNKTQEETKPKTNHQRNISISSIKMKENSNLLVNEMPLDVNMNRLQPSPPVIRVTYAPDVTSDPPIGSSSSYTNTDITDQHDYPETQMWMPGDDSETTPYFVTSNGPIPVSLV